jgi:phosphatidylserine/phosphatidylglycerophosphate/cardiolipin synthase-like enzyme
MAFQFLQECLNDGAEVDLFAYDLNEPDFVRELEKLGNKLRVVQDNSKEHTGSKALEPKAMNLLKHADKCLGHFGRFAHDKVLIKKQNGKAVKVLTGSTNFSITGLYVNANNVLIFDDPNVADLYEQVFEAAFESKASAAKFKNNALSKKEFEFNAPGLPHMFVSFAPHASATTSLGRVVKEIKNANSSVLFAIMALQGSGQVLQQLKQIHSSARVFSYGVTDSTGGAVVYRPGPKGGILVPTPALTKNVPAPFLKEFTDGNAHRIHHKFVVVDFNDSDPVLFTGSSNLADGGETNNGDNLLAIYDREIASAYAIEAIRLVDHYQFRAALQTATKAKPLQLGGNAAQWWKDSYDPKSMKYKERLLFSR